MISRPVLGVLLTALCVTGVMAVAEHHGSPSHFNPGIRPDTAEAAAEEKVAEDAWFGHLTVLAGDDLKGRKTGTPEYLRAAEYVETQFKTIGLKPAGVEGYRQPVGFQTLQVDTDKSALSLIDSSGKTAELRIGTEAVLSANKPGTIAIDAPLVFAGHGLVVPGVGVNDLEGLDLRGKIAVILAGAPAAVHGPLKAYYRTAAIRWKALKAAGAVGIVTIAEPRVNQNGRTDAGPRPRPIDQLSDSALNPLDGAQVVVTVPAANAAVWFSSSPHSYEELASLAKEAKPLPRFAISTKLRAITVTQEIAKYEAPNIVGLLPGSDRKLNREYVVLTAHLDHLGVGKPENGDDIYNGAMDNAVGIASLIETAKALGAGERPKRSILFIAFTGEEEGELGSQFYARYPTVQRSRIVAELNMDMYLPLFPLRFLEVQGLGESTLGNDVRAAAQLNDIEVQFDKQPDENRFIRSDQASFVKYGIPALAFKFGWLAGSPEQKAFNDWIHDRYHHPSDDLKQTIDREAAVHFDRVLLTLTRRVANAPTAPAWYPESFFSTIPRT
ncbi:M28 family peptidase [Occallatibacter savannae]|uniref:M28 family peptidase n=1 Tax=Occallatibacter savannae TaxID=1002691 RepID=UPI001EF6EFA3|nr:M28 family peptidase [Occallatibacter savannae]